MHASSALQFGDSVLARVLCVGDVARDLIGMQLQLDSELDFVIVACSAEAEAALTTEAPFDLIISDHRSARVACASLLGRLHDHSPDAERLIVARRGDREAQAMAASDGRVMRMLIAPCPTRVLRQAVSDALLRHRARSMRATFTIKVTPIGAHMCAVPC